MSLLEELESQGVTDEDLEKAASVRLFEKAAAAEGVDLDSLDVDQVEELYAVFLSNQSYSDNTKEASAMHDEIIDLFEKTAAAEGIDLDEMGDEELAELYNHYVENVLPEQMGEYDEYDDEYYEKEASDEEIVFDMFQKTAEAEGIDLDAYNQYELDELYDYYLDNVLPFQVGDKTAMAEVEEAQEKLAEAEILGRHMARAYMDEMEKDANKKKYREMGMAGPKGGYGKPTGPGGKPSRKQREAAKELARQRRGPDGVRRVGKGSKSTLVQPHTREFKGSNVNLATTKAKVNALKRFGAKHKTALIGSGLAAGGLAAGYAAGRGREKAASFDDYELEEYISEAASDLAAEWLYENGY